MKIEKLKKLKNGKYKLELDNGESITTYDDIIIKNMLFNGKSLDNQILSEISINNNYYDVYYKIVKMISTKWRSEKEVTEYMIKNEVSSKLQDRVIKELKKNDLLNDKRFAKSYANDAISLRKNGPYKIADDLKKLGISDSIIEETLNNLDEEEINSNLVNIITKKNKLNKTNSLYQLKNKLANELIRLGYDASLVYTKLNELLKEDKSIYQKEYDRLYKKYSKKYSGNELKYKVKQALYQKGFNYIDE